MVHSRDDEGVGMAHDQKPASIFPNNDGAVLVRLLPAFRLA